MSRSFAAFFAALMAIAAPGLSAGHVAAPPVRVLVLDTSPYDAYVFAGASGKIVTEVSAAEFYTVDLWAYDVLFVGSTFLDGGVTVPSSDALNALYARRADIAAFVESGRGLVGLSEPLTEYRYAWVPVPVASTDGFNSGYNLVTIADPSHPVLSGFTDADLSNWGASYHTVFTSTGSLQTIALGADAGGLPVTLAGSYGRGRIVLTGQDADYHHFFNPLPAEQSFVLKAVDWVAPKPKVSGCVQTNGQPIVGSRAVLRQNDVEKQVVYTDAYGCYAFDQATSGIPFKVSIDGPNVP